MSSIVGWVGMNTYPHQGWFVLILLGIFMVAFLYFITTRLTGNTINKTQKQETSKHNKLFMAILLVCMMSTMFIFFVGLR